MTDMKNDPYETSAIEPNDDGKTCFFTGKLES